MSRRPELVAIECPYSEDDDELKAYTQRAIHHCMLEGNIPFPRHMFSSMLHPDRRLPYPADLDCPYIRVGLKIAELCDSTYIYTDYGRSEETDFGEAIAASFACPIREVTVGRVTQEEVDAFRDRRNQQDGDSGSTSDGSS